jgi:hypothetical protein
MHKVCGCHCFQDGHEICFVGDEAFRELSQVDPKADQLLNEVSTNSLFSQSAQKRPQIMTMGWLRTPDSGVKNVVNCPN